MSERDPIRRPDGCGHDTAPYVLGALEPGEAQAFVSHLGRCTVCRDELAAFAPVRDALPGTEPARPVPRALRRRVLRAVRAEPKRRIRRRTVSPRAGWLALGLAATAALIVQLGSSGPRARVIRATIGQAQLRVAGDHGELVVDRLPPLAADRSYELWLVTRGRRPVPSTLFGVTTNGTADVGVPGDLHGVTRLLVTVEPRGGSLAPTTRAVIRLPLEYVQRS